MMKELWSKYIKTHTLKSGLVINVHACYEGDELQYYDLFDDDTGKCLNLGDCWYDDGDGEPTLKELEKEFASKVLVI